MFNLAFFLLVSMAEISCKNQSSKLHIIYKDGKAVQIEIPVALLQNPKDVGLPNSLSVSLSRQSGNILGEYTSSEASIYFRPIIPLTPGLSYTILQKGRVIAKVHVPARSENKRAKLIAIYPQLDTLPENLLKFYLVFSEPMQTGNSLSHIALLNEHGDTLKNIFLDLQPELWDSTGHVLTVWLDPGRIKRDLVLNREFGNPLLEGQHYELLISGIWNDRNGAKLVTPIRKTFLAGKRDSGIPDIASWLLKIPYARTRTALIIELNEALDHYLLEESISVVNKQGQVIPGVILSGNSNKRLSFIPEKNWGAGAYFIKVSSVLEDLAGNNLNRLFDRDLKSDQKGEKEFYYRRFDTRAD
ncbi:hypothetical protein CLV32_1657 [Pedobacter duraquae]|uniref:SbsA Ig-like domain-containing protein n=2 Tax=Pedobacter duraquae TaxID=425511 RepID=A0A4R6IL57_9SPHI|nr:hypothetical protein CLV32_1657 [Pedobacter duraquae]